jgi:hypothetical protein
MARRARRTAAKVDYARLNGDVSDDDGADGSSTHAYMHSLVYLQNS